MINIKINNIPFQVKPATTVLQACLSFNFDIPHFCYHNDLKIAGNCRTCLVEIKNSPKPMASCALPVMDNMEIFTNTPLVKKAREGVFEFLLINHPLDCPICDQGGECELQNQTVIFSGDKSRFFSIKRSVIDKNCGPFIKTIMNRCIHCTRCVRFAQEICGEGLGTVGRGNHTEISFYIENQFLSEFSGNLIDLCPVGALTSKPFAFQARNWELKKINTIDILNSSGSNIQIQILNNKIKRIIPLSNKHINNEWILNKTRFFFDSLNYQRIETPFIKINNQFIKISWNKIFQLLKFLFKKKDSINKQVLIGNLIDLKDIYKLKSYFNLIGVNNIHYNFHKKNYSFTFQNDINSFTFQNKIINIKESDLCLFISCNLRNENGIIDLHLRNNYNKTNLDIYNIGSTINSTYKIKNLGSNSLLVLKNILNGKHFLCKKIQKAKKPLIIFGSQFFNNSLNYKIYLNIIKNKNFLRDNWNTFNYLQSETSSINFFEILKKKSKNFNINKEITFLINTFNNNLIEKNFNIYIGHHFTNDTQKSFLILPHLTFLEKNNFFLTVEGSFIFNKKIINNLNQLQNKNILNFIFINFNFLNKIKIKEEFNYLFKKKKIYLLKKKGYNLFYNNSYKIKKNIIKKPLKNNWMDSTNILESFSKILNKNPIFKKNYIL